MDESNAKMPDGFPVGLRVLAVDDDATVLLALEKKLLKCGYKATVAHHAHEALKLLRANRDEYDLVISDVYMPDMDGFKLLEIVGLEMDLPVIMLSVDCDFKSVMKGIMHGAVDYLAKPVRLEELKLIWKHVVRRSLYEKKDPCNVSNKLDHAERSHDLCSHQPTKKCMGRKKERDVGDSSDSDDQDAGAQKKPRVTWTAQLHAKFINAVNQLGIDRAFPKRILDIMNESQLTRDNVASHLQKYRNGLKKNAMGLTNHQLNNAGTSGYFGSSLSVAISEQCSAISSFDRCSASAYKNMSTSSCFPAQQSRNGHALASSTCFPRPLGHDNNFLRQHMMNPQASQLGSRQLGLATNSYRMKASTQILGCQAFNAKSSQFDFYEQSTSQTPWTRDVHTGPNLVQQLSYAQDQQTNDMFLSNSLIDCHFSNELDAVLASEQELQQFSSCSGIDVEMGAQINPDSQDYQSSYHEVNRGSSHSYLPVVPTETLSAERIIAFNKFEHADDLHAVLKQFQC